MELLLDYSVVSNGGSEKVLGYKLLFLAWQVMGLIKREVFEFSRSSRYYLLLDYLASVLAMLIIVIRLIVCAVTNSLLELGRTGYWYCSFGRSC